MIDRYAWAGGEEAMLRFGPADGPVVIAALPLFEEANRTRAFAVTICRALATQGIASVLPDFPGTGESLVPLETVSILDMQQAHAGVVAGFGREGRRCFGMGIRSGALLDAQGSPSGRWHLAPQAGPDLLRELTRIRQIDIGSAKVPPDTLFEIAGNLTSPDFFSDLSRTRLAEDAGVRRRTVRLDSDPGAADAKFPGSPLWRRAEPDNDPTLAGLLAADIAGWIASCAG